MPFPYFRDFVWGTPVIPDIYWNAYTYEERIKNLCMEYAKMIEYLDAFADTFNLDKDDIAELKETFEKFKKSGFDDYYAKQVSEWIADNLEMIFTDTAKQVFFGLTDDGHFCAYVPESWSEITFDTGSVYGRSDYGRLILRYNADGAIDNTYSKTGAQSDIDQMKADLEYIEKLLFTDLDKVVNG